VHPFLIRRKIFSIGQSPVFGSAREFYADQKGIHADRLMRFEPFRDQPNVLWSYHLFPDRHSGRGRLRRGPRSECIKAAAMQKNTEDEVGDIFGREKFKFNVQAAFAPISIVRKAVLDRKPVWAALLQACGSEGVRPEPPRRRVQARHDTRPKRVPSISRVAPGLVLGPSSSNVPGLVLGTSQGVTMSGSVSRLVYCWASLTSGGSQFRIIPGLSP
jgi:hypothetical protein